MIFALVRRASVGNHGQPVCTENLRTCELQSAVVSLSLSLYIYIYTHTCVRIYIYIYIYAAKWKLRRAFEQLFVLGGIILYYII